MTTDLTPPDPARFDLSSFADLLPKRAPIVGEDAGSFDGFHTGMMQSLRPMTPYEGVIAENLIAIEWELLQHRRMRDAGLRQVVRDRVTQAVYKREGSARDDMRQEAWDEHVEKGGTEDDWEDPCPEDEGAEWELVQTLVQNAVSRDPDTFLAASAEIASMGIDLVGLMGEAYRSYEHSVTRHEDKMPELERRRREVMRDFEALRKARPVEAEVIEG